jgi:hypothetical protein
MNIMSAHSIRAFISSLDSSAAFFPISGLEPAPSQPVVTFQMFNFLLAREL